MPNATVRAAAEGLPDASNPQISGCRDSLRRHLVAPMLERAMDPAIAEQETFMNIHIDRRSLVTATAATFGASAMLASTNSEAALAAGSTTETAPSALNELIADYDWLEAEWRTQADVVADLQDATPLQLERIKAGNLLEWNQAGERILTPNFLYSPAEIDAVCDSEASIPIDGARAASEGRRARLQAELAAIMEANATAREATGLAREESKLRDIEERQSAQRRRVYSFRPATVDEFRARDRFIARELEFCLLTEECQVLIFGSANA